MGFLNTLLENRSAPSYDGYYIDSDPSLLGNIINSNSGLAVNENIALTYSAFYACVKVISETLATLPLHIYKRRKDRGKDRATDHPLYYLLHDEPNPNMTSFEWREMMMVHLLTWGNHYSWLQRLNNGNVGGAYPLRPDRMKVAMDEGKLVYIYRMPNGETKHFDHYNILHLRGLHSSGYVGLSPVGQHREAISLGMAAEMDGSKFYKNSGRPAVLLTHPGAVSKPARKNILESWNRQYQGLDNSHLTAILEEGMDVKIIGINPKDAQHMEQRKFQLLEMCRIHRLQAHKIQDLEHATFSNIEHQAIEFTVDTIQPWATRIEQALKMQMFREADKREHFPAFLLDGLLRGDIKTRYEAYKTGKSIAVLSSNDIRELENMNPIIGEDGKYDPAGDKYYHQNIWTQLGAQAPSLIGSGSPDDEKKAQNALINLFTRNDGNAQRLSWRSKDAAGRNKLREIFEPLFLDKATEFVRREAVDIRKAVEKYFKKRSVPDFEKWLEEFYRKHPAYINKKLEPLMRSYGEAIVDATIKEIDNVNVSAADLRDFTKEYLDNFTKGHIGSSMGQINKLIRDIEPSELQEALILRMNEWEERRPAKIASDQRVEASDAFARMAFVSAGVIRFVWVAQGSKPCPFCQELHMQVVGIEEVFVKAGDFEVADADEPMHIQSSKMHAPLHAGCVCTIGPG